MLSSKIVCNNTYSNKSWCIVSQGMFTLWEIDQRCAPAGLRDPQGTSYLFPPLCSPPRLSAMTCIPISHGVLSAKVCFKLQEIDQMKQETCSYWAKGSLGHQLSISTFMLSSKIICDNTYSNKSWCIISQGMFALQKIEQMEQEICSYLEWQLNVDPLMLHGF
jgi:hypothetical protein